MSASAGSGHVTKVLPLWHQQRQAGERALRNL